MRGLVYSYMCGAGTRAQNRFDELATRWRRRVLRGLRVSAIGIGVLLVVAARVEHHYLAWAIGLATGAIMALYVAVRDSPPPYIEAWRSGAQGERMTARALYALRCSGAVVLHDLPDGERGGNIDHVVVSRGGVFLLDSKFVGGEPTVVGDAVVVQRRDDDGETYTYDRIGSTLRGRAARLKQDIEAHTGVRLRVQAIAVLWPGLAAEVVQGKAVVFISGDQLGSCLQERKAIMSEEMVARIAAGITSARPQERPSLWRRSRLTRGRRARARSPVASSAIVDTPPPTLLT